MIFQSVNQVNFYHKPDPPRGIIAETVRLAVDDASPAEFEAAADLVFEAPGDIQESSAAFNKIVGELIYG